MTLATPNSTPTAADLDAARLLLARLGVSPADLLTAAADRAPAPTFAEYVPVVRAAVGAGTRRVYGSYWNRITEHWGTRRLDEPTPTRDPPTRRAPQGQRRGAPQRPRWTRRRRTLHRLWVPRTVSRPLISAFAASRPRGHGPQPAQHDRSLWLFDSPT